MAKEVERYYHTAKKIIFENSTFLNAIVDELMRKRTITSKDISEIKDKISRSA